LRLKLKLTTNYTTWTGAITRSLQTVALHVYLNPHFAIPRGNTDTKHHLVCWQKADLLVCLVLITAMTEEIQNQIGHLPTAIDGGSTTHICTERSAFATFTLTNDSIKGIVKMVPNYKFLAPEPF